MHLIFSINYADQIKIITVFFFLNFKSRRLIKINFFPSNWIIFNWLYEQISQESFIAFRANQQIREKKPSDDGNKLEKKILIETRGALWHASKRKLTFIKFIHLWSKFQIQLADRRKASVSSDKYYAIWVIVSTAQRNGLPIRKMGH